MSKPGDLQPDAAVPPPRRRRLLVPVLAVVVVLGLGGVGASFGGLFGGLFGGASPGRAGAVREADAKPVLVDVPDILSNLDTEGRRASFVKLRAKIEVRGSDGARAATADMPRVLDLFQTYLRSMRPEELKGGEGMYRLREALLYRLDAILAPVEVSDVLFTEMLVQ